MPQNKWIFNMRPLQIFELLMVFVFKVPRSKQQIKIHETEVRLRDLWSYACLGYYYHTMICTTVCVSLTSRLYFERMIGRLLYYVFLKFNEI